jgi:hypothetical protein
MIRFYDKKSSNEAKYLPIKYGNNIYIYIYHIKMTEGNSMIITSNKTKIK